MDGFLTQRIDVLIDFFVEAQAQTNLIIVIHNFRNELLSEQAMGNIPKKLIIMVLNTTFATRNWKVVFGRSKYLKIGL
jgi:hypothetical protein